MNLAKIKLYAQKRKGGVKRLAADVHMSEANMHRRIAGNDMMASDLEMIARTLGVSVTVFFDEDVVSVTENSATTTGDSSPALAKGNQDNRHYIASGKGAIVNAGEAGTCATAPDTEELRRLHDEIKHLQAVNDLLRDTCSTKDLLIQTLRGNSPA